MANLLPGESDTNSSPTLIDQSVILGYCLALLHSDTLANLVWWSQCELIQWLDASVKKLARSCGLFVGRSVSDIATVNGTQTYTLPGQFVSMLHVSYNGTPLRPTSTGELAARDSAWLTRAADPPLRWFTDTLGLAAVGLAPIPTQAKALWLIYAGWPQTVDCALDHTTIPLPWPLEPLLELEIVASAYEKEGDAFAPDIAKAARGIAGLYTKVALEYWGAAQ